MIRSALLALALLGCSGDGTPTPPPSGGEPTVAVVVSGLDHPLYLTAPAGDARLFIVEQPGRIRIVRDGRLLEAPFLDLTDRVSSGGERGLLSVAFHPRYAENGFFYVDYTDQSGDTRIERYRVSAADPDRADPSSRKPILFVEQPYANHNGGLLLFGPDGRLYVGMGDGGSAGDPHGNGQRRDTLLGKLLRLDVDGGDPYAVPADNPFIGEPGVRGEIWAYGLRNPWRFAFDEPEGTLYVADVGQNRWEEVNVVRAGEGGLDYGWNEMEGAHCFRADSCDRTGRVLPVLEYEHPDGCSITGGRVYRGRALPDLVGHYFYGDYCEGWVRSFRYADGRATQAREWAFGDLGNVLSFGADAEGELYILSANGRVYKLVPPA